MIARSCERLRLARGVRRSRLPNRAVCPAASEGSKVMDETRRLSDPNEQPQIAESGMGVNREEHAYPWPFDPAEPGFSEAEVCKQAVGNAAVMSYALIAFAKECGRTPVDAASFVGRLFAPSWD